jgi:hypothetical protein
MNAHDAGVPARGDAFARTPQPPHHAVIFTLRRASGDHGRHAVAGCMVALAAQQPGGLGVDSLPETHCVGITVPCGSGEGAIAGWHREIEHTAARARGRNEWYGHYELRVANVERAYGKKHTA